MISFNYSKTQKLKNFLKNVLNKYANSYYSQEGEDLILNRIFEQKYDGFYVDIGAHHPQRFSNTYFFYRKGWRGINVDAAPGSMKDFERFRNRDINIEAAISRSPQTLTFHMFSDGALNTFNPDMAKKIQKEGKYQLIQKFEVKTKTLTEILEENLPQNQNIDFMSVDVEGLDLEVLKSNNWDKFKPNVMVVESQDFQLDSPKSSEIYNFLTEMNYRLVAKSINTLIFQQC